MITKKEAEATLVGTHLYHMKEVYTSSYKKGHSKVVRVTGRCKTWKTRPDDFRLPVKYGLRESFYITPENADQYSIKVCAGCGRAL